MNNYLKKIHWILSTQFGLTPKKLIYSIIGLPRYFIDFLIFKSQYSGNLELMPCLHDRFEEGGSTKTEYFWQDIYVAQKVNQANPVKHVDIGSRIDGFVAHVASYREIEIFDIRKITSEIPNIIFKQADLMKPLDNYIDYCDSLSCLHALEHFGLGRYGDDINVEGYKLGLVNMAKTIKQNGTFYLSTPIGIERVAFNAHRIFNPLELKAILGDMGFVLKEFAWFSEDKKITRSEDIDFDITRLSQMHYALGIFTFVKQ
jgi:hypothetical protein